MDTISYMHLHVGTGRATLAIKGLTHDVVDHQRLMAVGVTFCSPEDQYTRKGGRERALERLEGRLKDPVGCCSKLPPLVPMTKATLGTVELEEYLRVKKLLMGFGATCPPKAKMPDAVIMAFEMWMFMNAHTPLVPQWARAHRRSHLC